MKKRYLIPVLAAILAMSTILGMSCTSESQQQIMQLQQENEELQQQNEELREELDEFSDIKDITLLNTDWDVDELYRTLWFIGKSYSANDIGHMIERQGIKAEHICSPWEKELTDWAIRVDHYQKDSGFQTFIVDEHSGEVYIVSSDLEKFRYFAGSYYYLTPPEEYIPPDNFSESAPKLVPPPPPGAKVELVEHHLDHDDYSEIAFIRGKVKNAGNVTLLPIDVEIWAEYQVEGKTHGWPGWIKERSLPFNSGEIRDFEILVVGIEESYKISVGVWSPQDLNP